ncbi:MAG: hypothetical protein ACLSHU_08145 [Oscillospiraceae bacterium]
MFIKFFGKLVELLIPIFWRPFWMTWCPPAAVGAFFSPAGLWCSAPPCVSRRTLWQTAASAISAGKITLVLRHDQPAPDRLSARQLDGLTPALRCVPSHQ